MPWKHLPAERLGIALAILAAAGFSLKAIFVKLAYAAAPVDAITLLALRMGFTLPVILWVLAADRHGLRALGRRDWGLLAALGLLGYYGASILDFLGLQYISAGLERLILFTYPTLTVLIGVLALGKRLERRQLAALGLSYAGIALAFAHDLRLSADSGAVALGAALVFGSALSYALYSAGPRWRSGGWGRCASRRWRFWCPRWPPRPTSWPAQSPWPPWLSRQRCWATRRRWRCCRRCCRCSGNPPRCSASAPRGRC
jgi:drug/metabolite transporter (DMT)-like permease